MGVVAHQHERVNLDRMLSAAIPQQLSKVIAIMVIQEDGSTIHAPLGDVQRNTGHLKAWQSRHGWFRNGESRPA